MSYCIDTDRVVGFLFGVCLGGACEFVLGTLLFSPPALIPPPLETRSAYEGLACLMFLSLATWQYFMLLNFTRLTYGPVGLWW